MHLQQVVTAVGVLEVGPHRHQIRFPHNQSQPPGKTRVRPVRGDEQVALQLQVGLSAVPAPAQADGVGSPMGQAIDLDPFQRIRTSFHCLLDDGLVQFHAGDDPAETAIAVIRHEVDGMLVRSGERSAFGELNR